MKNQLYETSQSVATNEDGPRIPFQPRNATEEEIQTLPSTVDIIPRAVWIVTIAAAAERFSFYAITAPWQNYLQNAASDTDLPGALGLGQSLATNINNAFLFFAYITPLPLAIMSDIWLGKYRTLCISLGLYICGATVLMATSLPTSQQNGAGVPGLAVSMVLIGLGVGGVKATISPFLIDQYTNTKPRLLQSKKGSYAIGQRTLTIQYICNVFYWATNIAGLSYFASTFLERNVGFWAAYLLSLCTLLLALVILLVWGKKLIKIPPQGNIMPQVGKCLAYGARNGFRLERVRPSYQLEHFNRQVPWTDGFVDEMKRGIIACRVIFSMVLFYLCYNQISTNLVSQAGAMQLSGFPNDAIQVLNPIACIIIGPIIQKGLYPFLLKYKTIDFGPIARITAAFFLMGASMAYAAGVQQLIYSRGPCYNMPLDCPASDNGKIPNAVSVWVQTPQYLILAVSEIFGFVTVSEYAYSKAPKNMKALVQALTQFTACIASAVGMGISPAAKDPNMVIFYAVLAGTTAAISVPFWWLFNKYDKIDENLNRLEQAEEEASGKS